jgi:hypothetical protein
MARSGTVPVSLALVLLSACAACPRGEHSAHLTRNDAIALADTAATSEGYDLSQWYPPKAEYEFVARDCTWFVSYDAKTNIMPGHFSVSVDDLTQRATVTGGL